MKLARVATMLQWARAFDLEGHKIQPGLLAPPVVCASWAWWDAAQGKCVGELLDLEGARRVFMELLADEHVTIIGANIAYDCLCMGVDFAARGIDIMPQIFAAYEAGRVWDLQIAEALHAIARGHYGKDPRNGFQKLRDPLTKKMGRYSLSICLDLVLERIDAKVNDKFRTSYALLEGTPIPLWPAEARQYPVDDACNTLEIALAQAGLIPRPSEHVWPENTSAPCAVCGVALENSSTRRCNARAWRSLNAHDVARQAYAAWAMHLGAAWGFCVDPDAVEALEAEVIQSRAKAIALFVEMGYLREEHDRALALEACDLAGIPRKWYRKKDTGLNLPMPDRIHLLETLRRHGAVVRVIRNTGALKRAVALAYGASGACSWCAGTGKVESVKSGNPTGCRMCDCTGLDLDSAPVPRTDGSKCRTCRGEGSYSTASKANPDGHVVLCRQCTGQPPRVPGCATGRDPLNESGDDDVLIPFAAYLEKSKIIETYIPFLKRGMTPDGVVEVDFDLEDDESADDGASE